MLDCKIHDYGYMRAENKPTIPLNPFDCFVLGAGRSKHAAYRAMLHNLREKDIEAALELPGRFDLGPEESIPFPMRGADVFWYVGISYDKERLPDEATTT